MVSNNIGQAAADSGASPAPMAVHASIAMEPACTTPKQTDEQVGGSRNWKKPAGLRHCTGRKRHEPKLQMQNFQDRGDTVESA
eukprot:331137-Pelagomonas_calceolata.AAC.2